VLVTPRMHGIHHSDIRDEDFMNFGVVSSHGGTGYTARCG